MQKIQALLISKLSLSSARHLQTALGVFASLKGRASALLSEDHPVSKSHTTSVLANNPHSCPQLSDASASCQQQSNGPDPCLHFSSVSDLGQQLSCSSEPCPQLTSFSEPCQKLGNGAAPCPQLTSISEPCQQLSNGAAPCPQLTSFSDHCSASSDSHSSSAVARSTHSASDQNSSRILESDSVFTAPSKATAAIAGVLVLSGIMVSTAAHAADDESKSQLMIGSSETLKNGPNLSDERELLIDHEAMVKTYTDNYVAMMKKKQPANKTEECMLSSDLLDLIIKPNSMVFWEGDCKGGRADGFGRAYVVTSGRIVFEMLANLHSDDPLYSTTYYTKNTSTDSYTQYYFGKSVPIQSAGVLITQTKINDDLTVGMQMTDKANLITYQKDTSLKSAYILNIKDYGNYAHFIHDLTDTPYRSLAMSYRMLHRKNNRNVGYEFTGMKTGVLEGKYVDREGNEKAVAIPHDLLTRVQEINDEVDINVESAIGNAIDALKIFNAYKNAVCDPSFNNVLCTKMKCKDICDVQQSLTPEDTRVKELLLRLVKHHNDRPLLGYIQSAVSGSKGSNVAQAPDTKNAFPNQEHYNNTTALPSSMPVDVLSSGRANIGDNVANANPQDQSTLQSNMYPDSMSESEREARMQDANAVAEAYKAAAMSASQQPLKDRMSGMFGSDDTATGAGAKPDNNQYGYGASNTYNPQGGNGPAGGSFNSQSSAMEPKEPLYRAQGPSIAPRSHSVPDDYQEQRQRLRDADQNIRPDLHKHDQKFTREQQQRIEAERKNRQQAINDAKQEAMKQLERDRAKREELLELYSPPTVNDSSRPVNLGTQ